MRRLFCIAALVALPLFATGCPVAAPAVAPVVVAGVTIGAEALLCGFQTYAQDSGANPPKGWAQIAIDLASNCGLDVEQLVALFGKSNPAIAKAAQDNAQAVHAAALAFHAGTAPATGAGSAGSPAASSSK